MVERYSIGLGREQIYKQWNVKTESGYKPIYNAAPGNSLPVITSNDPDKLQFIRWGLIPSSSHDSHIGDKLINARLETIVAKSPFADLIISKRCIILADGFYLWKKEGDIKTPFRVTLKSGEPMTFAGVWDSWQDEYAEEGTFVPTFSMITRSSGGILNTFTDRVPTMIKKENHNKWLDIKTKHHKALEFLSPLNEEEFRIYQISDLINNSKENSSKIYNEVNITNPGDTLSLF